MSGTTLRSEPRFRSRGRHRSAWSPKRLNNLRAWYDAELGQPKYGGVGAYVQLDGTSGDYIYTPDAPNVDITGDLEVVMRVYCNDWSNGANQTIASKYVTTGNQRSWRVFTNNTGILSIVASGDGTAGTLATAAITPLVALPDATWIWLRARLQLSNGANSVGTLDTAADTGSNSVLPVSWTANGSATGTTLTSIFNSTSPVEIGSFATGTLERFSGRIGRCIVRDGFNGRTLTDFNASDCYGPGYLNQGTLPVDSSNARYVPLRGVSGDYVWTADKAALRITGDIEIVARVSLADWTPTVEATVLAREQAASNRSFRLSVLTDGRLNFTMTTDGSTLSNSATTSAGPWTDGLTYWVKVTRRQSDGRVQCFYAADQATEPTGWTQLGADLTLSSGAAIYSGTSQLGVGARLAGVTQPLAGRVYRAIVRNGIGGTTVADFNAEQATVFGQAADGYGNGWFIADPKHYGNWIVGLPKIYDRSGNGVAPATFGAGTNQPTWLPWKNISSVLLTSSSGGNRLNTPSLAAYDTTDLDVWVDLTLADWSPSGETTLAARKDPSDPNQAWRVSVTTTGAITLRWYPLGTGASLLSRTSSVTLGQCGVVDGQRVAIRVTLDTDNGAGGYTITMQLRHGGYDGTWVTFDTFVGGSTTTLPSVNRVLEFGTEGGGATDGLVHRAVLASSINGAAVAEFDATLCGQTGYTDPVLSRVWNIARATSGRKTVVQSTTARSARSIILHGTDDYIDVPAAAIPALDTFAAVSSVTPVYRRWHNPGTSGHAIFTTKVTFGNTVLGANLRLNLTAGNAQDTANAGDGTVNDAAASSVEPLGLRSVSTLRVGNVSPFLSLKVNAGAASNDTSRTTTISTSTGGAGRIGAYLGGSGYIDMEFEALICRNADTTAQEHAKSVKYYRGGV